MAIHVNTVQGLVNPNRNTPASPRRALGAGDYRPRFVIEQQPWTKNFFASLKDFLTERPVKMPRGNVEGAFIPESFGGGFLGNLKEWFQPLPRQARRGSHSRM